MQQFGSSSCGSLLLQDCFLSIPAKLMATSGIAQQFINSSRQLVRRLQLNTSGSFSEAFDDIAEGHFVAGLHPADKQGFVRSAVVHFSLRPVGRTRNRKA